MRSQGRARGSRGQRLIRWLTLLAIPLLAVGLWWVQRPPTLPDHYQELDLPVTGLH